MNEPVAGLLAALQLQATGARTSEDIFTGISQWMPLGRVFGGQVLAQSVIAASRTVDEARNIHSLHGYFLRPGDVNEQITFAVDRIHDGRSFSTRRTQAYQGGLPILSMIASFQDADEGLDHQIEMPEWIPDPESLPSDSEILKEIDHPIARYWATGRAFDMRHIGEPVYFGSSHERVAHQAIWMKSFDRLPDDKTLHRAALAYASDYSLMEPIMRKHGISWADPDIKVASLDHAMWWHRFGRVDEWLLYTQESPNAIGGRGLATGRIFSREGVLLATVAQEGMIRAPRSHSN